MSCLLELEKYLLHLQNTLQMQLRFAEETLLKARVCRWHKATFITYVVFSVSKRTFYSFRTTVYFGIRIIKKII